MMDSSDDLQTVDDLLQNDAFRNWLKERRPEDQAYWRGWLVRHPERRDVYEQAVATFLAVQGRTTAYSDEEIKARTAELVSQMPDPVTVVRPLLSWGWTKWVAAATVAGALAWWQFGNTRFEVGSAMNQTVEQRLTNSDWNLVKNVSRQDMVVLLPDNSSVLLSANSQLRYRKQTGKTLREVFLQGEAFFEVSKDPKKPFVVCTNSLTTKVLGTSFQIRSFERESSAFVRVKTGSVSVTPATASGKAVLLAPNEKLSLEPRTEPVVKREVNRSTGGSSTIMEQQFDYAHTSVADIFDQLSAQSHIPIRYDKALLRSCTFTGKLNDVPLLEKIRLVCLTVESTFDLVGDAVIIHSVGCN